MNHNVLYDTVHRASIELADLMRKRTGSPYVRSMVGDALPVGTVPIFTSGMIGSVSLEPLGEAYYLVEIYKLPDIAAELARAGGGPKLTAAAMLRAYPGADTRGLQRLHPFAPLVTVAAQYAKRVNGRMSWHWDKACSKVIISTPRLELRVDDSRIECCGYVRRTVEPVPNPDLFLHQSMGHTTRTPPNLGAIYRSVAVEMPELAAQTKLLITVAQLAGLADVVTEQFEVDFFRGVAQNRAAWNMAQDLIVKSKDMPWKKLHALLRNLIEPHTFRQAFNTEISWVNYPYRVHHRERHLAALLSMQNQDLYAQKFSTTEIEERQSAFRTLQLQQQVR